MGETWFELTVFDPYDLFTTDSVRVTLIEPNEIPVADAGYNNTTNLELPHDGILGGELEVTVEGSGYDPDTLDVELNYLWNIDGEERETDTALYNLEAGTHTATLIVTDIYGAASEPDSITIIIEEPNEVPVANTGVDIISVELEHDGIPGVGEIFITLDGSNSVDPDTLDQEIWPQIEKALDNSEKINNEFLIKNTNRAVGTRISHHLYKKYGYEKLEENFLTLDFKGSAGQSFGAFTAKGLKLNLKGDANDYVGKGLSGATISIKLPDESNLISNENTIIGNTVLYGATSGKLFAAGQAGDRFAVRNSGATTVIEGCDSNGCEYMTGGTAVILGDVGDNFAAGMTGGMAFIYDKSKEFEKKVNPDSVVWQNVETEYWSKFLKELVLEHSNETGSSLSKKIIDDFENELKNFVQVCPKEMIDKLKNPISTKTRIKKVS